MRVIARAKRSEDNQTKIQHTNHEHDQTCHRCHRRSPLCRFLLPERSSSSANVSGSCKVTSVYAPPVSPETGGVFFSIRSDQNASQKIPIS
jgi:hypothetical protein